MAYEDYSQLEINNIIRTLRTEHIAELKDEEMTWLKCLSMQGTITHCQRDQLISMYDRLRGED